jgi:hypothetical protein
MESSEMKAPTPEQRERTDDWFWRGHSVEVIRIGIFQTLIRYRYLFRNLERRDFHVPTIELEMENDRRLLRVTGD